MAKKLLSFIAKMFIVSCVILCFYQVSALLSAQSSFISSSLVIISSVYAMQKFIRIDALLNRKKSSYKPKLRVVNNQKPLKSA